MKRITQRRKAGALCPRCKSPNYKMTSSEVFEGGKPNFTCGSCGNIWQYGYDGGMYAELSNSPVCHQTYEDGL